MTVPWYGLLPFAALLAAIATFPLMSRTKHLWEKRKFQLFVALVLGVPMGAWVWSLGGRTEVVHALVEYGSFITLLFSLFVVSGGVFVGGDIRATPRNNTLFLAVGAVLASFIGTTGAAMLLVRPLLNTNRERKKKVHTVVFTILVIANCGGLLTPLGDPPLFLGFLRGVPFLWTLNLLPQWLFVNGMLLLAYYAADSAAYRAEAAEDLLRDETEVTPSRASREGEHRPPRGDRRGGRLRPVNRPARDPRGARRGRRVDPVPRARPPDGGLPLVPPRRPEDPVRGQPVRVGADPGGRGSLHRDLPDDGAGARLPRPEGAGAAARTGSRSSSSPGGLSSVLDNAPTYVTFFELAKALGGTPAVAGVKEAFLVSISLGAVFCGAMTYIGNGPNFMVKAIAESDGVPMPSFGGYFAKWAFVYLAPVLALMVGIFIAEAPAVRITSALLAVVLAGWQVRRAAALRR